MYRVGINKCIASFLYLLYSFLLTANNLNPKDILPRSCETIIRVNGTNVAEYKRFCVGVCCWLMFFMSIIQYSMGGLFLLSLLLLLMAAARAELPFGCYQSNYTSTFTRCDLTFLFCFNYVQLKSCTLRKCDRFVRAGECLSQTTFVQDEKSCYKNCCGSDRFDEGECTRYNQRAQEQHSESVTNLTIALAIIASFLLVAVGFFLFRKLGCCEARDPFHLIRFNVKWKKVQFEDKKCEICHTYGSMLTTGCRHNFHVSCFQEAAKSMVCPTCGEPLRERIRIYCFLCRERAFKVKIVKIKDISDAIAQGKALHIDECPREPRSNNQLKT